MGNNAALEGIIASLQEYKAGEQPATPSHVDPAQAVYSFFTKLGDKIDSMETSVVAKSEEEVPVENAKAPAKAKPRPPVVDKDEEEVDPEDLDEEDEEEEATVPRGRKKVKNAMNRDEINSAIEASVSSSVAPIADQLAKLNELVTVMAQTQMQTTKSEEAPVVEAAPEVVADTVEKTEDVLSSKIDALTQQLTSLVSALTAAPQVAATKSEEVVPVVEAQVPVAEVAKSEELTPVVSNADRPTYTTSPSYNPNSHTPSALEANVDPQAQVVSAMKSLGFMPSSSVMRRQTLGIEAVEPSVTSEDETIELIKSAEDLANMSFEQINALRTIAGAW